jgi:hypothetical protein
MPEDVMNSVDERSQAGSGDGDDGTRSDSGMSPGRGLRRGLFKAANMQDKLLEK